MRYTINLLPPQGKRLNTITDFIIHLRIVVFGLIAIGLVLMASLFAIRQSITIAMQTKQTQLQEIKNRTDELQDVQKKIAVINDRADSGKTLTATAANWQNILNAIAHATPSTVKLTALNGKLDTTSLWEIQASATNQREMLIFQAKIEDSPLFSNSTITTTSLTQPGDPNAPIGFTMKFKLIQSDD